jgi:ribonuclease HI
MIGRKKKDVFAFIKDRVWKRINSWRGRALSRAGKEIMIKSVLQAIPSYVMSVYLLPDSTIRDIERMMNSYWWGGGANNKGIRWLAWDRLSIPKNQGGMGFRDLRNFNLALIAKQGWNIMTKPHTLVAKIYKSRYFPKSSFFNSKLGHNPSYAWRGIWKARQTLMHGCRWSIGDGSNIRVMEDPWLRGEQGTWIPSPQIQGVHNLTINELMVSNRKSWDIIKVESLFPSHVAKCILETPLFDLVNEDKLVWIDSPQGNYSVKSGYKLLCNISGTVNDANTRDDWSSLWKIHAPPKAKHLLWRICKGCLPTRVRLQNRHVPCPVNCPLCDHVTEDDWHVICDCVVSVQARQAAGIAMQLQQRFQASSTVRDLIFNICINEDKDTAGIFAMVVWTLWNNRNNKVWNDTNDPGRSIGLRARHLWEEWFAVQQLQHGTTGSEHVQQLLSWQKPSQGWYKCNVDAAFHREINKTSTSWCLRDHQGRFVMAETSWINGNCSIGEGEALAMLAALRAMILRNMQQVIFESDSKNVVEAIHHHRVGYSEFSNIISHIRYLLQTNPNFLVEFIKRQANMVAHTLARAAISWSSRCTFETLPLCITQLLLNEMI